MKQIVLIVIIIEIETLFPQFNKIGKIGLAKILKASYFRKGLVNHKNISGVDGSKKL